MSINLEKGNKINLTKLVPSLKKIRFCLGWDINKYDSNSEFDLDGSAFLSSNGKSEEKDFIFYGNTTHPSGAVEYAGDNRTGEGDGDDESITVNLNKLPESIDKITFVVTIFEAEKRLQNFGMVEHAYIRAVNEETNEEVFRFDLSEDFSTETGVNAGELYKHNGEWKFNAVGSGFRGGLAEFMKQFGLSANQSFIKEQKKRTTTQ